MDRKRAMTRLAYYVIVGVIAGAVVGVLLRAFGIIENPFWVAALGIFVASMVSAFRGEFDGDDTRS